MTTKGLTEIVRAFVLALQMPDSITSRLVPSLAAFVLLYLGP